MRIVKKGKLPGKRMWDADCHHCGSTLEAEESELEVEYDQRENNSFACAKCLYCNRDVIFYPRDGK